MGYRPQAAKGKQKLATVAVLKNQLAVAIGDPAVLSSDLLVAGNIKILYLYNPSL
jgi:hypothetical protein